MIHYSLILLYGTRISYIYIYIHQVKSIVLNIERGRGAILFSTRSSCALRPIEFKIIMRYASDRTLEGKKQQTTATTESEGTTTTMYTLQRRHVDCNSVSYCCRTQRYLNVYNNIRTRDRDVFTRLMGTGRTAVGHIA